MPRGVLYNRVRTSRKEQKRLEEIRTKIEANDQTIEENFKLIADFSVEDVDSYFMVGNETVNLSDLVSNFKREMAEYKNLILETRNEYKIFNPTQVLEMDDRLTIFLGHTLTILENAKNINLNLKKYQNETTNKSLENDIQSSRLQLCSAMLGIYENREKLAACYKSNKTNKTNIANVIATLSFISTVVGTVLCFTGVGLGVGLALIVMGGIGAATSSLLNAHNGKVDIDAKKANKQGKKVVNQFAIFSKVTLPRKKESVRNTDPKEKPKFF